MLWKLLSLTHIKSSQVVYLRCLHTWAGPASDSAPISSGDGYGKSMTCHNLQWKKGTDTGGNWAGTVSICERYGTTGNNRNHPRPQGCRCRTPGRCRYLFAESEGRHWNCGAIPRQSWRHNPDGGLETEGNTAQSHHASKWKFLTQSQHKSRNNDFISDSLHLGRRVKLITLFTVDTHSVRDL